jgi:hypothetical protein
MPLKVKIKSLVSKVWSQDKKFKESSWTTINYNPKLISKLQKWVIRIQNIFILLNFQTLYNLFN